MHPPPPHAGTSSKNQPNPKTLIFPPNQQDCLPPAPISGSNDLLSLFNLSSMYDCYVKPYQKQTDQSQPPTNTQPSSLKGDLKGKGKADISSIATPSPAQLDNLAQKRNKMEKSYGHFVADVGGRNSIKKDRQIESWITDNNFNESQIQDFLKPFSNDILSKSFTLKPGTLDGFDSSIWVAEEGGPKKKRKKRKQGEMLAGGITPTGVPQGGMLQQQVPPQHSQQLNSTQQQQQVHYNNTMNVNSTHHPTTSNMMTNQTVSSTMTNTRNHQMGNKSNRNVMIDSHQLTNQHRNPTPHLSQPLGNPHAHSSNEVFYGHEDHRKKKRTKLNNNAGANSNPASNNPNPNSGSASGSSNQQLAMQS